MQELEGARHSPATETLGLQQTTLNSLRLQVSSLDSLFTEST